MKFTSALLTAASGSIGGMVASRNRGGAYLRGRVIPVNPNTERQGEARANMATVVTHWTNNLDDTQRQAWASYATNTPTTDRLGASLILSGQQMFIKSTLPRLVAGQPIVEDGPITSGLATTPTDILPTLTVAEGIGGTLKVVGAGTAGRVNVYMSEPTPGSRSLAHAKRAFAFVSTAPVADTVTLALIAANTPYTLVEGLFSRLTFVYLGADGRISSEAFVDMEITAGGA